MPRRMGRPGLLGTMARTAVVAGTATAVAGGVRNRQQGRAQAAADEQAAQAQAAQNEADLAAAQAQLDAYQTQQPAPAAPEEDVLDKLARLGQLKSAGVLTDEEFAAAKSKLLGI